MIAPTDNMDRLLTVTQIQIVLNFIVETFKNHKGIYYNLQQVSLLFKEMEKRETFAMMD